MSSWNIPDSFGFSALINFIKQTRRTSDVAASDVSALQEDIQGLTAQTTETFRQVDNALAEMDSSKMDKRNEAAISIPTTGWQTTTGISYPKYCDLTAQDITAADRVDIMVAPASVQTAVSCGICPTCETLEGKIRIRAKQVPAQAISARYWVEKGKV